MRKINEECGLFGVFSSERQNVASLAYYGLHALQHRGQESCGIAVNDDGVFKCKKDLGLVTEVFNVDALEKLGLGCIAVGHTRYGTQKAKGAENCQPLVVNHIKGNLSIAHNGSLVNAVELKNELEMNGAIFHTSTDTEIISYIITRERLTAPSIEQAVSNAMEKIDGAYSLVIASPTKLIAVRDKHGFRPLCYGQMSDGTYIVASETVALDVVGAKYIRDIEPGEILVFKKNEVVSIKDHCNKVPESLCIFEYIYFARPDSIIDGSGVHEARLRAGKFLAQEGPVDADVVVGVPDSGIDAAMGYAEESGIPYKLGFIKNKYIGRTFIVPGQGNREKAVKMKLNVVRENIEGKRVILIDDSIVRGTTSGIIVKLLREAGAKEVHMRVSSPKFLNACYYGTDIDSPEHLIANNHTTEEIAKIIGVDSLHFLSVENVGKIPKNYEKHSYCKACFNSCYPTKTPNASASSKFDKKISE